MKLRLTYILSDYKEIQIRAPKTAAYYISPIEIGVFWLEMKCLKSATRLLNRVCVGRRGLDLSKEVLWVSVCQRAAELPAGKVGGLKKNTATRPDSRLTHPRRAAWKNFFSNLQLCQLVTQLPFDILYNLYKQKWRALYVLELYDLISH